MNGDGNMNSNDEFRAKEAEEIKPNTKEAQVGYPFHNRTVCRNENIHKYLKDFNPKHPQAEVIHKLTLHLREERKEFVNFEMKRLYKEYECNISNCKKARNENHLFSRNWLKKEGGSGQNIFTREKYFSSLDERDYKVVPVYFIPSASGINKTSIFESTCVDHDAFYNYIDNNTISINDNKYINLLMLRSISFLENKLINGIFYSSLKFPNKISNLDEDSVVGLIKSYEFLINKLDMDNPNGDNIDKHIFDYSVNQFRIPDDDPIYFVNHFHLDGYTIMITGITQNKILTVVTAAIPQSKKSNKKESVNKFILSDGLKNKDSLLMSFIINFSDIYVVIHKNGNPNSTNVRKLSRIGDTIFLLMESNNSDISNYFYSVLSNSLFGDS